MSSKKKAPATRTPPSRAAPAQAARGPAQAAAPATALTPPAPDLDPAEFDKLVEDILEHPDRILDPNITAEQILEVQKRLNPYASVAGPAPDKEHKRMIACCYTNLREDYLRRLNMTGLVGFIFQMLHEWEVPADQRSWIPEAAAKKTDDPSYQPFDVDKLVERLEATAAIAKEAQAAKAAVAPLREKALAAHDEARRLPPAAADADKEAAAARAAALDRELEVAECRATGLLYAATHATHRAGLEAGARLHATADAGMKHPEVREIITRFPLPLPPGLVEMPGKLAKGVIGNFLRHWLEFDPSVHVRSGYDSKKMAAAVAEVLTGAGKTPVAVDTKDPSHLPLETIRAAAPKPTAAHKDAVDTIFASKAAYNAVVALLRDEDLTDAALTAVSERDDFMRYLLPVPATSAARPAADVVPPQDTFHRLGYYMEVNYEELRTITEAIYPEKPDLDWAIAVLNYFEGTQKEVDEQFDAHCQRYQDETPSSIKALELGSWSLLADFKENRKKIQFYNKHTEVLKRILDRHAEDKRIGGELMRNRVRQTKAKNIAQDGPDAAGLKDYKRNVAERGQDISSKGAERVISQEEMRRLEKAKGNIKAAQELELLEQYEKVIADTAATEKLRPLTEDEKQSLEVALLHIARAREMVAVPDGAIQVDVFSTNAATGEMEKTHIYTKADEPPENAGSSSSASASASASSHPAVRRSVATAAAQASAPPQAPLAPYAVEHMVAGTQRSVADMRAEAARDHDEASASASASASATAGAPKGQ